METANSSVEAAKQFLLTCLTEQAHKDKVPLSQREKQLFLFSESDGTITTGSDPFLDMDEDAFERKISRLLRKAYATVKKEPAELQQWRDALAALRNEDFYGLVMVDLAKIPRPKPRIPLFGAKMSAVAMARLAAFFLTQVLLLAVGGFLVLDPLQQHWIRPD